MQKPITTEVIRQALRWQGVSVSHVRCLSAFEDSEHNSLADFLLIFTKDDFRAWAETHGMDWREAMIQDFKETVQSSFCRDFGPWAWAFLADKQEVHVTVSFLLFAHDHEPAQLAFDDISWLCDDNVTL